MPEDVYRDKLATCSRILAMQELLGLFGHISVYDPGAGRMYMSPSMGVDKAVIEPGQILVADLDGQVLDGAQRLPIEWPIHTVLHGRRSDALAIAHLHAPFSTLFAIAKTPFRPVTLQGAIFSEGVPIYEEPQLVRSKAQGEKLAGVLGEHNAAFVRGHGVVVVGRDVEEMLYCALILEDEARQASRAAALGDLHCLSHEDCQAFGAHQALPDRSRRAWSYYARLEKRWDKNPGTGRTPFV